MPEPVSGESLQARAVDAGGGTWIGILFPTSVARLMNCTLHLEHQVSILPAKVHER